MSAWYRQGTVSVANGSTAVTGQLTAWNSIAKAGDPILLDGGWYEVAAVAGNTTLTLATPFAGSDIVEGAYAIAPFSAKHTISGEIGLKVNDLLDRITTAFLTSGPPNDAIGGDGSLAFDPEASLYYFKSDGAWSGGVSLIGSNYPADKCAAFYPAKLKLQRNAGDVSMLVIGDSTGNETSEPIYHFAQARAAEFPAYSVDYRLNDGSGYGAPTIIQAGSGPNTLRFYNASAAGYRFAEWLGARFAHAIAALPSAPDLILINDGLNRSGLMNSTAVRQLLIEGVQQIWDTFPGAPISFVLQNPLRDNENMEYVRIGTLQAAEMLPGVGIVDYYSTWWGAGKPTSWYADGTHPSAAGIAVNDAILQDVWRSAKFYPPPRAFDFWWAQRAKLSFLGNGNFAAFSSALPDSWTEGGTGSVSKDEEDFYPGKSYSVKIDGSSAKYIRRSITGSDLAPLLGKRITVAVRMKVAPGGPSAAGRVLLQSDGTTPINTSAQDANYSTGGWIWKYIDGAIVPRDATYVRPSIYATANATPGVINVDEAHIFLGDGRPL